MCSTKSLLAGDGEIIAQIYKERVVKRGYGLGRLGLEDGISRNDCVVSEPTLRCRPTRRSMHGDAFERVSVLLSSARLALAFIVAFAAPVNAQQRNPDNSVNSHRECGQ